MRFDITEDSEAVLHRRVSIPADQRWFWTSEWQAGEREASADIATGRTRRYSDIDEMFRDLNAE